MDLAFANILLVPDPERLPPKAYLFFIVANIGPGKSHRPVAVASCDYGNGTDIQGHQVTRFCLQTMTALYNISKVVWPGNNEEDEVATNQDSHRVIHDYNSSGDEAISSLAEKIFKTQYFDASLIDELRTIPDFQVPLRRLLRERLRREDSLQPKILAQLLGIAFEAQQRLDWVLLKDLPTDAIAAALELPELKEAQSIYLCIDWRTLAGLPTEREDKSLPVCWPKVRDIPAGSWVVLVSRDYLYCDREAEKTLDRNASPGRLSRHALLGPGLEWVSVLEPREACVVLQDFLEDAEYIKGNLRLAMEDDPEGRNWYPELLHEARQDDHPDLGGSGKREHARNTKIFIPT
ncbi:hypothetical protein V492_01422 [Pseudogymnoascus sp. VKM F-4246]|nr:hypothetical protein V492_01422 [Pseudogymnoascus sp. VKM F-4246]